MGLYLGSTKVNIISNGSTFDLNIPLIQPDQDSDSVRLVSSDNYVLKDSNGVYLVPKEAS